VFNFSVFKETAPQYFITYFLFIFYFDKEGFLLLIIILVLKNLIIIRTREEYAQGGRKVSIYRRRFRLPDG